MHIRFLLLTTLILLIPAIGLAYGQGVDRTIYMDIDEHGVTEVVISTSLDEGLHEIPLPVPPLVPTIVATSNGLFLPIVYDNGNLYMVLDRAAKVEISYIANVSVTDGVFVLEIVTSDIVELRIPQNIILLSWPHEHVVSARVEQGVLILGLRGPTTIRYTVRVLMPPTATPTPTIQTPTPTPKPTPTQPPATPPTEPYWYLLPIAVVIATGLAVFIYFLTRKRGSKSEVSVLLGDVDMAIVKALESSGGRAFQSELQSHLGIPKTTLWKHIKKLEKLGIIKVEKVGGKNVVVLIKKVKSGS